MFLLLRVRDNQVKSLCLDNTFYSIRAFLRMIFRSQSLEFTTCQHLRISVTSYFQTSSKDILLSVSLPQFSCPPCLEYLCPRALILLRLRRYINHVLTYLLTYLLSECYCKAYKLFMCICTIQSASLFSCCNKNYVMLLTGRWRHGQVSGGRAQLWRLRPRSPSIP